VAADMTPDRNVPTGVSLSSVVANLTFEIIPLKSAEAAIAALPPNSTVSVTCSPVKGLGATQELADRIRSAGHLVIPHLAARMVESRAHLDAVADWLATEGIGIVFVVGGDAEEPAGPCPDGTTLIRDLLDRNCGLRTIGVPSYPDGHPLVPDAVIDETLLAKQQLLDEAGINGWTSTQMCFDPNQIVAWAERERAAGLHLPIHLGIPGVVERTKLLSMGMRLGVGTSLRYLRKNRGAVSQLLARSDYDPGDLLGPLTPDLGRLGITGLHCFTFNQVATTARWRDGAMAPEPPAADDN